MVKIQINKNMADKYCLANIKQSNAQKGRILKSLRYLKQGSTFLDLNDIETIRDEPKNAPIENDRSRDTLDGNPLAFEGKSKSFKDVKSNPNHLPSRRQSRQFLRQSISVTGK